MKNTELNKREWSHDAIAVNFGSTRVSITEEATWGVEILTLASRRRNNQHHLSNINTPHYRSSDRICNMTSFTDCEASVQEVESQRTVV